GQCATPTEATTRLSRSTKPGKTRPIQARLVIVVRLARTIAARARRIAPSRTLLGARGLVGNVSCMAAPAEGRNSSAGRWPGANSGKSPLPGPRAHCTWRAWERNGAVSCVGAGSDGASVCGNVGGSWRRSGAARGRSPSSPALPSKGGSARPQPGGEPRELATGPLPEERSSLSGAPEPRRLAAEQRRVRLAGDRGAEERELLDRRRRLRVGEVGNRVSLRGREMARPLLAFVLGFLGAPRDLRRVIVAQYRAEPRRHLRRHRGAGGERLGLAMELQEVVLVVGEPRGRAFRRNQRGEGPRQLLERHLGFWWERRHRLLHHGTHARRLGPWRRRYRRWDAFPGPRAERQRQLGVAAPDEHEEGLPLVLCLAHRAPVVGTGPRDGAVHLQYRVPHAETRAGRGRILVHRSHREPLLDGRPGAALSHERRLAHDRT